MNKRVVNNRYSRNILKNGYEEMAKINLSYAESGIVVDSSELISFGEYHHINSTVYVLKGG